tara:strand:+ start:313 stop:783 length:471 start_codon:yes stop_codon:yes gene_type:complete
MTSEQAINPVIIRKYANRRLYDTSTSKYVTINNLAKMVKDGIDFRVIDVTSGQDLTRFSLVQIILEIESDGHEMLPIPVLRQLIQFYGDRMEPILSRYLERTMNAFLSHQGHIEDALGASLENIRSGAKDNNPDNLQLIRDEFDLLRAKIDRLEAS